MQWNLSIVITGRDYYGQVPLIRYKVDTSLRKQPASVDPNTIL